MDGMPSGGKRKMKVTIVTEIMIKDESGEPLISEFVEETVRYEDKWSVKNALTRINEKAQRLFDTMRQFV